MPWCFWDKYCFAFSIGYGCYPYQEGIGATVLGQGTSETDYFIQFINSEWNPLILEIFSSLSDKQLSDGNFHDSKVSSNFWLCSADLRHYDFVGVAEYRSAADRVIDDFS